MELSENAIRPLNTWDYNRIQPGPVGSVGDVNMTVRLKHSSPDLPLRYDSAFSGKREIQAGANVTDGDHRNYVSGGGPAFVKQNHFNVNRSFKTNHGQYFQDLRAPDKLTETFLNSTPQLTWQNKVARSVYAKVQGDHFLPLPHGYTPGPNDLLRGGNFPFVRDFDPGNQPGSIIGRGQNLDTVNQDTVVGHRAENQHLNTARNYKPAFGR